MPPGNHQPKTCPKCGGPVFWAARLDERGHRIFVEDAKTKKRRVKSIPVDPEPTPRGTLLLFDRPNEGIVARELRRGEAPPAGAVLRSNHYGTCRRTAQETRR